MTGRACSKSTFSVCSSRKKNVKAIFHLSPLPAGTTYSWSAGEGQGVPVNKKRHSRGLLFLTERATSTVPSTGEPKVRPLRRPAVVGRALFPRATDPEKLMYATVAYKPDASEKIFGACPDCPFCSGSRPTRDGSCTSIGICGPRRTTPSADATPMGGFCPYLPATKFSVIFFVVLCCYQVESLLPLDRYRSLSAGKNCGENTGFQPFWVLPASDVEGGQELSMKRVLRAKALLWLRSWLRIVASWGLRRAQCSRPLPADRGRGVVIVCHAPVLDRLALDRQDVTVIIHNLGLLSRGGNGFFALRSREAGGYRPKCFPDEHFRRWETAARARNHRRNRQPVADRGRDSKSSMAATPWPAVT